MQYTIPRGHPFREQEEEYRSGKLNGHLNLMSAVLWKTPGFEINDLGYLQQADRIMPLIWAGYNQWEPKGIYRSFNVNADIWSIYNFGGVKIQTGIEGNISMTFKNFWNAWIYGNIQTTSPSTPSLLQGRTDNDNTRKIFHKCRIFN